MTAPSTPADEEPVVVLIQAAPSDDGDALSGYTVGARALLVEYQGAVLAGGPGTHGLNADPPWPVNVVVRFPGRTLAEGYFSDPRYLDLVARYRVRAYRAIRFSYFRVPAPAP